MASIDPAAGCNTGFSALDLVFWLGLESNLWRVAVSADITANVPANSQCLSLAGVSWLATSYTVATLRINGRNDLMTPKRTNGQVL